MYQQIFCSWLFEVAKKHSGDKPLLCDEYFKLFSHTCDLKKHIGSHSGDKTFSCDMCPISFLSWLFEKAHDS